MKFYKIERPSISSSIIVNFDLVEKVSINTKSNTAQVNLCSGEKLVLATQELKDFLKALSKYNSHLSTFIIESIEEKEYGRHN